MGNSEFTQKETYPLGKRLKRVMNIHPAAIVSEKAKLSEDIEIGPYAVIEDDVKIGRRVKIYSRLIS